jgi:hypothetical protein
MKPSTRRIILRCVHLIAAIPVIGYIYQPPSEVGEYQRFTQLTFIPIAILSGYWMYAGFAFAIIGAVTWIAASYFSGFGAALLAQIVLFGARFIWMKTRRRQPPATA